MLSPLMKRKFKQW